MLGDRDYMRSSPRYGYSRPRADLSIIKKLIIINCLVYFFCSYTGDFGIRLQDQLALTAIGVEHFQFWRLGTYMFVHAGFWHLFFNMYGLYIFGQLLEKPLGSRRFMILYLLSGLIGGLLWMLANWNSYAACVGASGALFGVMVAAGMAFPQVTFVLLIPPIPVKLWVLVWVYCIIEIFSLSNAGSHVAHLAHLGGALGGFIYMRRLGCKLTGPNFPGIGRFFRNLVPKPRTKTHSANFSKDTSEPLDPGELDRVLDRISIVGYDKLTEQERDVLRRASEKLKSR
ncbi:MAG: rhomboid family intramembrane serine protease [Lentisphaeria bacterium]